MNHTLKIIILTLGLGMFSGCVYTDITLPLDQDVWETKLGTKVGKSSTHTLLWLVAWGDGGTMAAARQGNITVVQHMDMSVQSYLFGVYSQRDTIVYGD